MAAVVPEPLAPGAHPMEMTVVAQRQKVAAVQHREMPAVIQGLKVAVVPRREMPAVEAPKELVEMASP